MSAVTMPSLPDKSAPLSSILPLLPTPASISDLLVTSYTGTRDANGCMSCPLASLSLSGGNRYTGPVFNGLMHSPPVPASSASALALPPSDPTASDVASASASAPPADGKGEYRFSDGTVYRGPFFANEATGAGAEYRWTDGSKYVGEVRAGMRHGKGTYVEGGGVGSQQPPPAEDKKEEDGGEEEGHGTSSDNLSVANKSVYVGDWEAGRRSGTGTLHYGGLGSTTTFVGQFKDDLRHGKGTLKYPNDAGVYEGDWHNDQKCGHGTMVWYAGLTSGSLNGEWYVGTWQSDVPSGYGEHVWADDSCPRRAPPREGQDGEPAVTPKAQGKGKGPKAKPMLAGKPAGDGGAQGDGPARGDVQHQRFNVYRGMWANGMRCGEGTFLYANGSEYTGEWKNNKKEGLGTFTSHDGRSFTGMFVDDRLPTSSSGVSNEKSDSKGGRATEDVNPQLRMDLGDIEPGVGGEAAAASAAQPPVKGAPVFESPAAREGRLLDNLLLRYHTDLKTVYKMYAQLDVNMSGKAQPSSNQSSSASSPETAFTMSMDQFRHLLRDSGLLPPSPSFRRLGHDHASLRHLDRASAGKAVLSFADVCDILYRMRRYRALKVLARQNTAPGGALCYVEPPSSYDSHRPILFREFVEGLVRVAHTLYCRNGGGGPALREAVTSLLEGQVLPSASSGVSTPGPEQKERSPLLDAGIRACLSSPPVSDALLAAFGKSCDGGASSSSPQIACVMSPAAFDSFAAACSSASEGLLLPQQVYEGLPRANRFVFPEFCEAVARMAVSMDAPAAAALDGAAAAAAKGAKAPEVSAQDKIKSFVENVMAKAADTRKSTVAKREVPPRKVA